MKESLLNYLRTYCRGKAKAQTVKTLAREFKISEREIRQIILEFNMNGYPVATSCNQPSGVYWAIDQAHLNEYWMNLNSRVLKLLDRMRALDKIKTRDFVQKQMELF